MPDINKNNGKLVYSIKDRCRVCYTCVRECPVKAIKIINGQAEVIQERCIACGNCTRVCSQGAKAFLNTGGNAESLLNKEKDVYAIVAPSFISEFKELDDHRVFVGMLKKLGFSRVFEVAFGADMVAREYSRIISKRGVKGYISSDCPAIVSFIEKYYPELTGNLAPITSPMVAMARYINSRFKDKPKLVFIGPCIAKKSETAEVDEEITFLELRELFLKHGITGGNVDRSEFDPPRSGKGAIFPISRGLLQSLDNQGHEDLEANVIVAEGRVDFQEAIREYNMGAIDSGHLELLCCEGCIMGPGTSKKGNKFERRLRVLNYVREKMDSFNREEWERNMKEASKIDLSQTFRVEDQRIKDPAEADIREVLLSMNKKTEKDHLNCGACGYDTCRNHAIAIIKGLAEREMCLPGSIEKLHETVDDLAVSNDKLRSVQQALKQTEKLAHMGQLSAGIAHELNNPLGVVIMYSNILLEEASEDSEIHKDLELIVKQAERCKSIVGGLLNFARKNQVNHQETNIGEMVDLSISSVVVPDNVNLTRQYQLNNPWAEVDAEQMVQVISNLVKNAIEAMPGGGHIRLSVKDTENQIHMIIEDSGMGISERDLEKVFEPFFTTKGIGKGTGLGLATAYGVIKMHKGKIEVESNADPSKGKTFTRFIIQLPRRSQI